MYSYLKLNDLQTNSRVSKQAFSQMLSDATERNLLINCLLALSRTPTCLKPSASSQRDMNGFPGSPGGM